MSFWRKHNKRSSTMLSAARRRSIPHPAAMVEPLEPRRHLAAGDLDDSFGINGIVKTDFLLYDMARAVAVFDDKIIAVGDAIDGVGFGGFAMARYDLNGTLDASFGNGGKVFTSFPPITATEPPPEAMPVSVERQSSGRLILGGTFYSSDGDDLFTLAGYHPDGSLDLSFGPDGTGFVRTNFDALSDSIAKIIIEPDQKIIAVGRTTFVDSNGEGFADTIALARYSADGILDTSFGSGGKVIADLNTLSAQATSAVLTSNGQIVVSGAIGNQPDCLVRFNSDGSLDTGFGTGGRVCFGILNGGLNAIAQQPDGDFLLAGGAFNLSDRTFDFGIMRSTSEGVLDATFGTSGVATLGLGGDEYILGTTLQANGKIVVAGQTLRPRLADWDFAVARFNSDGTLDREFAAGGYHIANMGSETDFVGSMTIQPDGKILVAGASDPNGHDDVSSDFALARFEGDALEDGFTAVGANVVVTPRFLGSGTPPSTTVTFASVSHAGVTTMSTPASAPSAPEGFQMVTGERPFDLSTTATFSSATVCTAYDQSNIHREGDLGLFHLESGHWVDRTTSLDTAGNEICASASSFSLFSIFERIQLVQIDIKPGSAGNIINVAEEGLVPVTILSTPQFDVRTVDVGSVRFADSSAVRSMLKDANGDGRVDLLLWFRVQDTSLRTIYAQLLVADLASDGILNSTRQIAPLELTGSTIDGDGFRGFDTLTLFLAGKALRDLLKVLG
jgi:uncharacterized delta-60 repeat protein